MLQRRKIQIDTREHRFLKSFLKAGFFSKYSNREDLDFLLVEEPYTGFGYPDVVGIIYDKKALKAWSKERNKIKNDDLKVLHHIYSCKKGKSLGELNLELGFPIKELNQITKRLLDADLAFTLKDGRVKNRPINNIFFIKEIISIEAKLKDWKGALQQSRNNLNFSSKSYSLFPKDIIKPNIKENYRKLGIGLLSYDDKFVIESPSKKISIPSSLSSWHFNEYLGRNLS